MLESAILHRCMLALSQAGCTVFRNNVAMAWVGKAVRIAKPTSVTLMPGDVVVRAARPLHAGLCKGSGDLIGWTKGGRFLSVEVKTESGRVTEDQEKFRTAVNEAGGVGIIARSADDVLTQLMG